MKFTEDCLRDLSIQILDKLVDLGVVPDCTDTNNEAEFEVQDCIHLIIKGELKRRGLYENRE